MNDRARDVQTMFAHIAGKYDLLNRLMTFGRDISWRKEMVRDQQIAPNMQILDVGCGTGDLAMETLRQQEAARVTACDFTWEMVIKAKARPNANQINWVIADAMALPFRAAYFDRVMSGFLLRNVTDQEQTYCEQARVLKPNGRFATLDTTPKQGGLLKPFIQFYLLRVIPRLGAWLAGDKAAYTYLPDSTNHFLSAETLAQTAEWAGFKNVTFKRKNFGTIAIHSGEK